MSAVVVVGASSEIGREVAVSFARLGYEVHAWGRNAERLQPTVVACQEAGASQVVQTLIDVRDTRHLREAVRTVTAGGMVTDVVWAAGAFQWGRFDTVSEDLLDDVLATVFTSAAVAARAFAPALVDNGPSRLIFIGSAAGRQAYPDNAGYVAAKHGLRGLAESLHLDLCDAGVKVSLITAGLVDAGAGRDAPAAATHGASLLRPVDIASAVQYIVSSPPNVCPTEIVLRPSTRHA